MLVALSTLWASPVDTATAKQVATRFYQWKTQSDMAGLHPEKVYTYSTSVTGSSRTLPVFFVYNMDGGYVIVSADNRITPVIAYSTEGPFDPERVLPAMAELLNDYAAEIADYLQSTSDISSEAHPLWRQIIEQHHPTVRNDVVVPPLLSTRWDQNGYYNDLCPSDSDGPNGHAYAGCVATALAQVIRYWEYPSQGTGSHSYISDYGTESANFGATTYNYALMPDMLTSSTPAAQRQAVSQLIYHCGVSVEMDYGPDGSSASTSQTPTALTTYFGYTSNPSYKSKSNYTTANWKNLIKGQLNNLRPVLYRGQGDAGAHAFVCDGYDSDDYFHFNWGWSGSNNGFFLLSNMTPGSHEYNSTHGAVINVFTERPLMKVTARQLTLYSLNGSSDTAAFRVLSKNGGQQVLAVASGNFSISDGTSPFADTLLIVSGNQVLYVRYQSADTLLASHHGTVTLTYDTLTTIISLTGEAIPLEYGAPQNPGATYLEPVVHLTWTPPTQNLQTFAHGETSHATNYGYSNNYARTILYRMSDTDQVAFYPACLTHISFYLRSAVTACKLVVYQGGSYDGYSIHPGTLVLEQPLNLSQLNAGAWNSVPLQTPVPIVLGEELWYGIYLEAPGGSYAIPVGNTASYVPEKGDVACRHYASGSTSWSFYNVGRNFSLQAQFQSIPPMLDHYRISRDSILLDTTSNNFYDDVVTHSGSYTYRIAAVYADGAAAEVTTDVLVQMVAHVDTVTAQICSGDTFLFHGQHVAGPGSYFYYANDTLTVLQLTVNPTFESEFTVETCDTYTWNGLTYSASGDYPLTFASSVGCDSVVTLHLTVHPHPELLLTASSTNLHYPDSATLTASGADHFQWSTGETAAQIVVCPTVPTTYTVTATMDNSPCQSSDSIWIYTQGYGIATYDLANVSCYPNPVTDVFYVSGISCDQLHLYNMEGRLCRTWKGKGDEWRLSARQIAEGTYLLVGENDGMPVFARRVVVKR